MAALEVFLDVPALKAHRGVACRGVSRNEKSVCGLDPPEC